jgi:hypothetical protein
LELLVAGRGGVAADAAAVALNVTVADPTGRGFVTVYPCGATQPTASNVNFVAGSVVPNAVISKVGADGKVCVFVSNDAQLVVDVNGYFRPPRRCVRSTRTRPRHLRGLHDDRRFPAGHRDPRRRIDHPGADRKSSLRSCGRAAVVLNVTVTEAERPGFVTVYPCGTPVPTASNINYLAGSTVANLVVSKIGINERSASSAARPRISSSTSTVTSRQ